MRLLGRHAALGWGILLLLCGFMQTTARAVPIVIPVEDQTKQSEAEKPKNLVPGPMISPQAYPGGTSIPKGTFAIIDHVTLSHGKDYNGTSRRTGARSGPKSNDLFVNVVKFRYGIADGLDIRTSTPFLNNEVKMHGDGGKDWKGGIADTTVILRYQLKPRTDDSPYCFAVDLGVILPTGHTGDKSKYLATNAFGMSLGGGASWIDNNQRLDFDGAYTAYTEGKHDIKPGNYWLFHGHYAYALSRYFDVGAETWFRVEEASEVNGSSQKDSYTEWYAGPKVQLKVPEWQNLTLGAAVLFPVYRYYESTKLSTDARFEFRASVSF